jgi:hypothetical protein
VSVSELENNCSLTLAARKLKENTTSVLGVLLVNELS